MSSMVELNKTYLQFTQNVSQFLTMRVIDKAILADKSSPEQLFFDIISASQKSGSSAKAGFFSYLDKAEVGFFQRAISKIAFSILFPIASHRMNELLTGDLSALKASFFTNKCKETDRKLKLWIERLKDIRQNETQLNKTVLDALNGMLIEEDSGFIDALCNQLSIGDLLYNKIRSLKTSSPIINLFLQFLTFTIGTIVWLLMVIPDALLRNIVQRGIHRVLKSDSLVNWITRAAQENKGILTPILRAVSETIEEFKGDLEKQENTTGDKELHAALVEHIALNRQAVQLFHSRDIKELKSQPVISFGNFAKGMVIDSRIADGIENILVTLMEKAKDRAFLTRLKERVIHNVQKSFESPTRADEKKHNFFESMEDLFAVAIAKQISSLGFFDFITQRLNPIVYKEAYKDLERTYEMTFSPQYIRFNLGVKA